MAIAIRKPEEIEKIQDANRLVAKTLAHIGAMVKPGVTTKALDEAAEAFIVRHGGRPSFKGLYDFPSSVCTSVNGVIIHGIPDDRPLEEGEIVGLDIGVDIDGWYGDAAVTLPVGTISEEDTALIACAKDALAHAIESIHEGMRFKQLSQVLEQFITGRGFVPLRGYCGHGIGRRPHEEPSILNYVEGKPNQGPKIKNGMVFCIEPMICRESGEAKLLEDKWSVVSTDGKRGSHYEHTVAVVDGKARVLSLPE